MLRCTDIVFISTVITDNCTWINTNQLLKMNFCLDRYFKRKKQVYLTIKTYCHHTLTDFI